jgi:hypothetical protein
MMAYVTLVTVMVVVLTLASASVQTVISITKKVYNVSKHVSMKTVTQYAVKMPIVKSLTTNPNVSVKKGFGTNQHAMLSAQVLTLLPLKVKHVLAMVLVIMMVQHRK